MEQKSAVTLSELFTLLDLNKDGELSRSELHESAWRLGWHWNEAPIFAVFDLLTILNPVSKDNFIAYMTQIIEDPHGPFGKVLLNASHFLSSTISQPIISSTQNLDDVHKENIKQQGVESNEETFNNLILLLKQTANLDVANTYQNFLKHMSIGPLKITADNAAVLIIDPQRAFTKGVWMQSIGFNAELEVKPIQLAFENCAQFLNENHRLVETMFTRCPFPPGSYDWDDAFTGIIDARQLYFIKPGNSVLFPSTNRFREWIEKIIKDGKRILVIGGCTLNSCVRESSIDTLKCFKNRNLQILVDLSLSGARTSNYMHSSTYAGLSAVESAIREMMDAGVKVAQWVSWT